MAGGQYFNPEKVECIRKNIASYDWAKALSKEAVDKADTLIGYGKHYWWTLPTPNELPRCLTPGHINSGCPFCGDENFLKFGSRGWIPHIVGNKWKMECKNCGGIFPSNDFKSYYESGLDELGIFRSSKADPSYLVNTLYPEKGPDYMVDDGRGYVDETNNRWSFVAFYNHYGLWANWDDDGIDGGIILSGAKKMSEAYVYTGKTIYALYCLLLLYKVALLYPDLDLNVWMRLPGRPYRNTDGFSLQGKATGRICEAILARNLCMAADAVMPVLRTHKEEAESFFSEFASVDAEQIEETIVDGLLRQVFIGVQNGSIGGNEGMYQSALAIAAVCMGECEESKKWIEWLFQDGEVIAKNDPIRVRTERKTGGNLLGILYDKVNGDGFGNEISPTYNRIWLVEFSRIADILSKYPGIKGTKYDLNTLPKMKKMYKSYPNIVIDRDYVPKNGDTGRTGDPLYVFEDGLHQKILLTGYEATGDMDILKYYNICFPESKNGVFGFLDIEDPKKTMSLLQKAAEEEFVHKESVNLADYGNALLRSDLLGGLNLHMYYGRTKGHGHMDKMNFEIIANRINYTPDLGYPEYAEQFPKRYEWTSHTISHNTVMVDLSAQNGTDYAGYPIGYEDGPVVKYIEADDPSVYDQTNMYRRAMCTVETSPGKGYVADFFRVQGGSAHELSFHGGEGNVTVEGIELIPQKKGTLQGEDTEFGRRKDRKTVMFDFSLGRGNGYHYLYDVAKAEKPCGYVKLTYCIKDTWAQRTGLEGKPYLDAYFLTETDRTVIAKGQPPVNKIGNPPYLYYYLGRRQGEDLKSNFVSVYEPYIDNSEIRSVEKAPFKDAVDEFEAVCVKVTLTDGRVDYLFHSLNEETSFTVRDGLEFKGRLGFVRFKDGRILHAFLSCGEYIKAEGKTILEASVPAVTGYTVDFQKNPDSINYIDVAIRENTLPKSLPDLLGRYIYIETKRPGNAVYQIQDIQSGKNGKFRIIIDETPIRGYKNGVNGKDGFSYRFEEGAAFTIPLSFSL
ncbi:MAG: heparinase II/III domain-containing protein [Clostridia bacterium]|jgi:hypothetical protein